MMADRWKIGDKLPPEKPMDDAQRFALKVANMKRGSLTRAAERVANGTATTMFHREAAKIVIGMAEREHRYSDPFERARMFLQRKGHKVFAAYVLDPDDPANFYVGTTKMSRHDVIAKAKALGFTEQPPKENEDGENGQK